MGGYGIGHAAALKTSTERAYAFALISGSKCIMNVYVMLSVSVGRRGNAGENAHVCNVAEVTTVVP